VIFKFCYTFFPSYTWSFKIEKN